MSLSVDRVAKYFTDSWSPSPRKQAEQLAGFILIFALQIGWGLLNSWFAEFSDQSEIMYRIIKAHLIPNGWALLAIWVSIYLSQTVSIWSLWRKQPFFSYKPEIALYLSQFTLQILWSLTFFFWQENSLALVILLMQVVAALLCTLAFWKKNRIAGICMVPLLATGIFMVSLNMAICLLSQI